jgi:hypothetical protein
MIVESLNIPKTVVHPAEFCSRDFFLCDNARKAASLCQFLTPQKNVKTFYHPPYSPDVSPLEYFLFPKLKMKLKGLHFADVAEIQEALTDELKKVQKKEFLEAFQKLKTTQKPLYMLVELILNLKSYVSSSCVFDFLKKSVLKLLDCTVYVHFLPMNSNTVLQHKEK